MFELIFLFEIFFRPMQFQTKLSFISGFFSGAFLGRQRSIGLTHLQQRYRTKQGIFSFGTKQKKANQKQNSAKMNPARGYLKFKKKFKLIYGYNLKI